MSRAEITFNEGELHHVTLGIPDDIIAANYTARIEVRLAPNKPIVFEFEETIVINGQTALLTIPATLTIGKSGNYQWQLMLFNPNDPDDVKLFDIEKFTVIPALTKRRIT